MRKFAWRDDPDPDASKEYFSCAALCRKQGTDKLSLTAQQERNCALPYFDVSTWTGKKIHLKYMGAKPRYDREGKDREGKDGDWQKPKEDTRESGCPGAWYRTDFIGSVLHYYRNKNENGGRIANRAFDLCEDPLVIEAVNTLENYEGAWLSEYRRQVDAKHKK